MKIKNKILMVILWIGIFFAMHNVSYAGTQKLNLLDYQVQILANGNMEVVEIWDIYVSETNTLFKDFDLDSSKYSGIANVQVKDLTNGKLFTPINTEMYHVTKDYYYALPISGDKFEIAWGVGLDDSSATKKYQISYTVEDAVHVYNDCSQLYWMFVGEENGIPAKKVTGTIKLPKLVKDNEKLRVWAHGPLNGEIQKKSNDTVTFEVNNFEKNTMLEARIVVEEPIFEQTVNKVNQNKLASILEEEGKWADEANRTRNRAKMIGLGINLVIGIIFIFFLTKIKKYFIVYKQVKNSRYQVEIGKYFRDIPREKDATPAEAAFLYYANKNRFNIGSNVSKVFSATLLQLCLKKHISFDCEDKKDIKINLLYDIKGANGDEARHLKPSEDTVLRFLYKIAGRENLTVSMSQIKKYAKSNYDSFDNFMETLKKQAKSAHVKMANYDEQKAKEASNCIAKTISYIGFGWFVFIFSICLMLLNIFIVAILAECIICAILLKKTANAVNVLTEQGEIERQQWKGLKKYMEDFSMLNDKEIPDLILWEKYLVYATAFGISDKVVKQLKIVYPQMQNLEMNTYTYLYLMSDTRFSNGFVSELDKSASSVYSTYKAAYNSAHSSSSGGGGGFSGGGGGRWWRWPEWDGR